MKKRYVRGNLFLLLGCLLLFVSFISVMNSRKSLLRNRIVTTSNNNNNNDLAAKQSFGFFNDIPDSAWAMLREISTSRQRHVIPSEPAVYFAGDRKITLKENERVPQAWFQSHYEPDFSCMFRKRVGGNGIGDGPKWVCDPHRIVDLAKERKKMNPDKPGCLIYSIGSCGDFTFEVSMLKLLGNDLCEVHTFDIDDYESKVPKDLNIHFHHWGIDSKAWTDEKNKHVFKTIAETMKELGHLDREMIDVFKIDCEGCEYDVFSDLLLASHPMLQQMFVEVHQNTHEKMTSFFDAILDAGYVMFSKEHNIQYPKMSISEYSFLKLSKDFRDVDAVDKGHFQAYK